MNIELQFWQAIFLLLSFFGFVAGAGKLLLSQIDKRLDLRFQLLEEARKEGAKHWDERFGSILAQQKEDTATVKRLERDLMGLRAELPERYVRREDYIRGQTVIEAKLDSLALRMENIQLKGVRHES
ncbi:hypothetical protein ACET32_20805 [Pseudomonas aeruginosa]